MVSTLSSVYSKSHKSAFLLSMAEFMRPLDKGQLTHYHLGKADTKAYTLIRHSLPSHSHTVCIPEAKIHKEPSHTFYWNLLDKGIVNIVP